MPLRAENRGGRPVFSPERNWVVIGLSPDFPMIAFAMSDAAQSMWDDLPDELVEELLARAAGGEAVFCERLALPVAA